MKNRAFALPVAAGLLLTACASLPSGPSVMVLPGSGKSFEQFQTDDAVCRGWAERQTGTTPQQVATETTVSGAAIGTVLGTAAGAAIGAASGSAGTGAAVGAGAGLLGGTAIGASSAWGDTISIQRRYDMTYMQCMYSKGNQIPVARGSQPAYQSPPPPPPPPPPAQGPMPPGVPPPPPGSPPPPPPGTSR